MASGVDRMPLETRMSREDYAEAKVSSRWKVERDKLNTYCKGMNPEIKQHPNSDERAVRITVSVNQEMHPNAKPVNFRILIPNNYPNSLPMIFPDGWTLHHEPGNHTYQTKPPNRKVHICTIFEHQWSRDCTIAGLSHLASVWYHKYLHWKKTNKWPGKEQFHCGRCGKSLQECTCR